MRTRCIKYKCDRCGFEKIYEIDDNGEFKDSTAMNFFILNLTDGTHLCPDCECQRQMLMEEFMRGVVKDD